MNILNIDEKVKKIKILSNIIKFYAYYGKDGHYTGFYGEGYRFFIKNIDTIKKYKNVMFIFINHPDYGNTVRITRK